MKIERTTNPLESLTLSVLSACLTLLLLLVYLELRY